MSDGMNTAEFHQYLWDNCKDRHGNLIFKPVEYAKKHGMLPATVRKRMEYLTELGFMGHDGYGKWVVHDPALIKEGTEKLDA